MKTKLLEPIEGYKWSNYDKRYGINPSGDDILSNLLVESGENLIFIKLIFLLRKKKKENKLFALLFLHFFIKFVI